MALIQAAKVGFGVHAAVRGQLAEAVLSLHLTGPGIELRLSDLAASTFTC